MNATAKEILTNNEFDQLKSRLKTTWMTGDYDVFARSMEKDAELFYRGWASNREPGCSTSAAAPDNLR